MRRLYILYKRERAVWLFAALYVATALVMLQRPYFTNASEPVRSVTDPVLALQMARSVADVEKILEDTPSPDREVMRVKQYEDFVFIAAYLGLLVAMGSALAKRWRALGWVLVVGGLAIATSDVSENLAVLRVVNATLDQTTQPMVDAIRHFSWLKWGFASAAFIVLSIPYAKAAPWYLRAAGGLDGLAAVAIVIGLMQNPLLSWAALLMGLATLYSAVTLGLITHESASRDHLPRPVRQN